MSDADGAQQASDAGAAALSDPPTNRVRWRAAHRYVSTRYPPISLFERIADPDDWDALYVLESMTNPRVRQDVGDISLVPSERRVFGPGASIVMAPFTHISPDRATRFSAGMYGVYYAANAPDTALREVAFHMARFHHATNDPPLLADYRGYAGSVDRTFHDIRGPQWEALRNPDPNTYPTSQAFAARIRAAGSNGLVYASARHSAGMCIAAFWPDVVSMPKQADHVALRWDGTRVVSWIDRTTGAETALR
ncbi:MAG: RES family NAD+ phosphorylase [Pseudomonadota bacterium]